jgi:exopolysaccharide biosynthesis protein
MLILVVVDGRKKGRAIGMSLPDLADVMIKYGATDAINLDGGGSSVMAMRDPATHRMQILNQPSDGRERSVADVLGVRLAAKK